MEHRGAGVVPEPLLEGAGAGLAEATANAARAARMIAVLRGEAV